MGYSLEEHLENGQRIVLGEPFLDLRVAKVIASRRAVRTGRVVVVNEEASHREVARYEPSANPVRAARASDPFLPSSKASTRPQKNSA